MSASILALPQDKPLVIFVGGFCDSIVKPMLRVYRGYENPYQVKVYYGHTMGRIIEEQIVRWREESGRPIVVIGHSYGADTVVRVAERLMKRYPDPSIDLLITVDPVSRQHGVPKHPITSARRWLNTRVADPHKAPTISNIVALIGGHWKPLLPLGLVEREHEVHPPADHVSICAMMEPFWKDVQEIV